MREKTGVEGDEFQFESGGKGGGGLDVFAVLLPGRVGGEAAGEANAFHGRIVFADAAEHAGDDGDAVLAEEFFGAAPEGGGLAEGIEGQLHAAEAGGLEFCHEVFRVIGLQRPTAHGQTLFQRRFSHKDSRHFQAAKYSMILSGQRDLKSNKAAI